MRPAYNAKAPKRPVTLCLNEDLVAQVRDVTNNLSGVVESLLADFVCKERARRGTHPEASKQAVLTWNAFGETEGSFADEHSDAVNGQVRRSSQYGSGAIPYVVVVQRNAPTRWRVCGRV